MKKYILLGVLAAIIAVGSWAYLGLDATMSPFRPAARKRLPGLAGKCCGRMVGSLRYRVLFL